MTSKSFLAVKIIESTEMENAAAAEIPETNETESVVVLEISVSFVTNEAIEGIEVENIVELEITEKNETENVGASEIIERI
jgi:phosphoserine aminotransferase